MGPFPKIKILDQLGRSEGHDRVGTRRKLGIDSKHAGYSSVPAKFTEILRSDCIFLGFQRA